VPSLLASSVEPVRARKSRQLFATVMSSTPRYPLENKETGKKCHADM